MAEKKTPLLKEIFSKKMLIVFLLGFSSGLPLFLTGGTLKTWLAREQVDITTIGYMSWVGLAYSLKFIWAPLIDRFTLFSLGRRRSWMLTSQLLLVGSIAGIGMFDPKVSLMNMAALAVLTAFFSATQDIVIDAYRRELLKDEELGFGSSMNMYGYRIAMLISGAVGMGFVGAPGWNFTWNELYFSMAALMGIGIFATLWAPEPKVKEAPPKTLMSAVVDPFREFLKRDGAYVMLLFVFLFKLGDALSGAMLNPYYVQIGYSNADIALIAKTFGLISSLFGLFLGSTLMYYIGIYRSLWVFGILQALSTGAFALLTYTGPENWALGVTVCFEDITAGMGSAAFIAYISAITNKRYTATQYAILSSIATLGRNFFSGFTGEMVKNLGWANFYYTCMTIAIPGLLMLVLMRKYQQPATK
ncbi:AmpG family muropeptide MFS transporter [Bdellovibrio sp. HCB337]|uniref:AmpG family muropeptide MFS transporter n=1 Tax=Bdellovibrio sp. HCB337 TaxID=3394358 RepID=UPI0039A444CA